jgi:hypothetical protein
VLDVLFDVCSCLLRVLITFRVCTQSRTSAEQIPHLIPHLPGTAHQWYESPPHPSIHHPPSHPPRKRLANQNYVHPAIGNVSQVYFVFVFVFVFTNAPIQLRTFVPLSCCKHRENKLITTIMTWSLSIGDVILRSGLYTARARNISLQQFWPCRCGGSLTPRIRLACDGVLVRLRVFLLKFIKLDLCKLRWPVR